MSPLFFAEEARLAFGARIGELVSSRLLAEAAPTNTATCVSCGGSVGRVERLSDAATGGYRVYLACRECGPVRVDWDDLRRWAVDVPGFLAALGAAAGIQGPPGEVVPGRLWWLGKARWAGRSREVFFCRNYHRERGGAVLAALKGRPKAILLMPSEDSVRAWGQATANLVLTLESVLSPRPVGLCCDQEFIEGRLIDAGLADPVRGRQPARKRAPRAANIEALVREIKEHLRAARDYAFTTKDQTGAPALLPRPQQKDLAKRCGLSESDVSRCLNDPQALQLRLLWETAEDLDRLMGCE